MCIPTTVIHFMIRPLSESLYDYRRVYAQENHPTARNSFKRSYLETCMFIGAEHILSKIHNEGVGMEEAIREWNREAEQGMGEKEDDKDYKTRLDEVFVRNGKGYYKRKEALMRSVSKDKSEERR